MAVCLAICFYVFLPPLLSDSMPACLSALSPHYAFRDRGREREREIVCVCEREGNNWLRLALRLDVRAKAWLAACLGDQVAVP